MTPTSKQWLPFVPCAALSLVHVAALFFHNAALAQPTKLGLMPLLALAVFLSAPRNIKTPAFALLLVAIAFSWLGDGAGTFLPFLPPLPMMLLFFALAHLAYIGLFLRHTATRPFPQAAAVLVLWWVGMLIVVGPHAGALLIPVALYGLVLGATTAAAARTNLITLVGAILFLASDTILSLLLFLSDMPAWTDAAVMLTYTLGQGLIAAGVLHHLRKQGHVSTRRQLVVGSSDL